MSRIKDFFSHIGTMLLSLFTMAPTLLLIIINFIGAVPILYFDFPFNKVVTVIVATMYMFLGAYSRFIIIILYIAGLIHVINLPQNVASIIYYVLFGFVVVFEIIPCIIGFVTSAASNKDK